MEEEDEKSRKVEEEPSMRDPDASKDVSVVQDRVETPKKENIDVIGSEAEIGSNDVPLEGVDSVITVEDEDHFEHVSLKDQDIGRLSSGGLEEAAHNLSGAHEGEYDSSPATETRHDRSISSPGPEKQIDYAIQQSSSSTSLDSYYHGDIGYSPMGSPAKPKAKAAMPNVSPELLHLVDSAIMGKPESLDKLKNFVNGVESFGTGEEAEGIAFLVVDSLLATMGGVESFEQDEDNNPPSVMLNSRAAIVACLVMW